MTAPTHCRVPMSVAPTHDGILPGIVVTTLPDGSVTVMRRSHLYNIELGPGEMFLPLDPTEKQLGYLRNAIAAGLLDPARLRAQFIAADYPWRQFTFALAEVDRQALAPAPVEGADDD